MQLRRHVLTPWSVCAVVVALSAVGCTAQPTAGTSTAAATPPSVATSPAAGASSTTGASSASAFNATDTAWILLMIPMTERARRLTDLAPSRTADPALAALAAKIGAALRGDLRRLRTVLRSSGVPDTHPHEGHDMPGMVGLGTLDEAAAATGPAFDRLLGEALRAHFTQSRTLCAGERAQGRAGQAKDLAAAIARRTTQQLALLDELRPIRSATPGGGTAP
ncbi:DUF305 domain-containing protein [Streptomyces apricus]|uniref:DUF305 domain-containing protein n=1 Tax=Streptomyces apricus TaxID=1828112 RepID=A0A5B0BB92_9ACTN|nr:DUF305 domain-containing protein [Streptomyces apricus]KAA0939340.1 DUF305 domain-containing protein [Streptomyces apricus]